MKKIPVVIPFYKEAEKLERCLAHLQAQTYKNLEIFVRDNTHDNIYYTAAVNEGLRKFCYDPDIDIVVVLNQDANLAPDAITLLEEFLRTNVRCGIASPVQHTSEGQITWAGSLQAFPAGRHRKDLPPGDTTPFETYWANGAAFAVRTEVVREIGLLDKNLRFIGSDADFSFTARARGWTVNVVPRARCQHGLGASAGTANLELSRVMAGDMLYFGRKWLCGDLYRQLAYDGPSLTRTGPRMEIERLERVLAGFDQRL
jgi:GT2 family glycosyltransferase